MSVGQQFSHITGAGLAPGEHMARASVVIDTRGAVLLDSTDSSLVDHAGAPVFAFDLGGRINKDTRRSHSLYLFDVEAAARLAADLAGLAHRAGLSVEFHAAMAEHLGAQT